MGEDDYEHNTSFNIRSLLIIYSIIFAILIYLSDFRIVIFSVYILLIFGTILFFVFAPFRIPLVGKIYFYLRKWKWMHKLRRKRPLDSTDVGNI
jgi:hypothetical protein